MKYFFMALIPAVWILFYWQACADMNATGEAAMSQAAAFFLLGPLAILVTWYAINKLRGQ